MQEEIKKLKEKIKKYRRRVEILNENIAYYHNRFNRLMGTANALNAEIYSIKNELGIKNFRIVFHAADKDNKITVPVDKFVKGVCVDHAICLVKQSLCNPDAFELKSIKIVK